MKITLTQANEIPADKTPGQKIWEETKKRFSPKNGQK